MQVPFDHHGEMPLNTTAWNAAYTLIQRLSVLRNEHSQSRLWSITSRHLYCAREMSQRCCRYIGGDISVPSAESRSTLEQTVSRIPHACNQDREHWTYPWGTFCWNTSWRMLRGRQDDEDNQPSMSPQAKSRLQSILHSGRVWHPKTWSVLYNVPTMSNRLAYPRSAAKNNARKVHCSRWDVTLAVSHESVVQQADLH